MTSDAPWPVRDRDAIISLTFTQDPDNRELIVIVKARPDYLEKEDGYVRIRKTRGNWSVKVMGDDLLDITLQMHTEPGGSIPSWLANNAIIEGPFDDFRNIRRLLSEE
jgi:hypothetical protein